MKLSLSGRLVESGGKALLPADRFIRLAKAAGYDAVDLRATQLSPQTSEADLDTFRTALDETGLAVFEGQHRGGLEDGAAFVQLAELVARLGGQAVRVGGDLPALKRAAQLAAPAGVRVVYQMHTGGPFETVASAAAAVAEIDEPNFGVMPEPSNLLLAGQPFAEEMFEPLAGRILGVHVQTIEVHPEAEGSLKLADGTEVCYRRVPYAENRQVDFATFFAALRRVGFDGYVNELEPCPGPDTLEETVTQAARFLRPLLG